MVKLEESLVKEIGRAIEKSGLKRSEFDIDKLCKSRPHVYGEAGSQKRHDVGKKFWQLKKKEPHIYKKWLHRRNIKPGKGLLSELDEGSEGSEKEEESESSSESSSSSAEESEPKKPKKKKASKKRKKKDHKKERSSKRSSVASSSAPAEVAPPMDDPAPAPAPVPTQVPTPAPAARVPAPAPAPVAEVAFARRSATMSVTNTAEREANDEVMEMVRKLENPDDFKLLGSEHYPYIIIMDLDRPEHNMGFEACLVPKVDVKDYSRDVVHIRKVVSPGQEDEYIMTIPTDKYPQIAHRSVLVECPSQDFWHQDPNRYHMHGDICEATKVEHETLRTTLGRQQKRLKCYYLLVFPRHIHFQNNIISGDDEFVLKGVNDMTHIIEVPSRSPRAGKKYEDLEIYGMDVYWRIAVSGGNQIRSPERPRRPAFASRKQQKSASKKSDDDHEVV